jgi:hypothetical protein
MNCCYNCFKSIYLSKITFSTAKTGNCDFCLEENTSVFPPKELIRFFRNILNQYLADNEKGIDLYEAMQLDFDNTILSENVVSPANLLKAITENEAIEFQELFENKVISKLSEKNYEEKLQAIHGNWENFKNEIKKINRFHITNTIDLRKLEKFFSNEVFLNELKIGHIFYRNRIITAKKKLRRNQMGNPPDEKASAGRANPKGISYLYLADSVKTAMYETRASLHDFVAVGKFKLKEKIKILDLYGPMYDPIIWSEEEEIEDYFITKPFIQTLQKELSLPIRKIDKEIDYLPTQYLCEFIKSIGFDGVKFQSSLNSEGFNLAIFNTDKFECIKVSVYGIEDIELGFKEVTL